MNWGRPIGAMLIIRSLPVLKADPPIYGKICEGTDQKGMAPQVSGRRAPTSRNACSKATTRGCASLNVRSDPATLRNVPRRSRISIAVLLPFRRQASRREDSRASTRFSCPASRTRKYAWSRTHNEWERRMAAHPSRTPGNLPCWWRIEPYIRCSTMCGHAWPLSFCNSPFAPFLPIGEKTTSLSSALFR